MQGKRFGAGILAGLILGILVVASPGPSALGGLGSTTPIFGVSQTTTTIHDVSGGGSTSSNQPTGVLSGSENSTSTVTVRDTGNTDEKAGGSPRASSSLSRIASQPAVLAPLFLAFVLGGILYSVPLGAPTKTHQRSSGLPVLQQGPIQEMNAFSVWRSALATATPRTLCCWALCPPTAETTWPGRTVCCRPRAP